MYFNSKMNMFSLRKTIVAAALFGLATATPAEVQANNVSVTNLSYNGATQRVTFNLSWENSWRNTGIAGTTQNYDGVWVFVKFRDACAKDSVSPSAGDYQHMWLNTNSGSHTIPSGVTLDVATTDIGGTPRGMGVFIYRSNDGTGTVTANNISLQWDIAAMGLSGTDWDIQVFAVEMVRIPQGSYYLGDGVSLQSYRQGNTTSDPFLVNAENAAITLGTGAGELNHLANSGALLSGTLAAGYPKGYDAFWVMKYEVTQKQYCDFLNTLSRSSQVIYAPNTGSGLTVGNGSLTNAQRGAFLTWSTQVANRNGIRVTGPTGNSATTIDVSKPVTFVCDLNQDNAPNSLDDGMSVACNFLRVELLYGFLDWAALRPMNDFEYEKIARGPSVSPPYVQIGNELVWGLPNNGSNHTFSGNTMFFPGQAQEVPTLSGNGLVWANINSPAGPRRVGGTHGAAADRNTAGSSFYGVADMAGNVEEIVVRLTQGTSNQPTYTRDSYGDGKLNSAYTALDWPTSWLPASAGVTGKGGSWLSTTAAHLQTSTRFSSRTSSTGTTARFYTFSGCSSAITCTSTSDPRDPLTTSTTGSYILGGRGVR